MSYFVLHQPYDVRGGLAAANLHPATLDEAKALVVAFTEFGSAKPFIVKVVEPDDEIQIELAPRFVESLAALMRYHEKGIHPGGFLAALLAGDGFQALDLADQEAKAQTPALLDWMIANMDPRSYGSAERVSKWRILRGDSNDDEASVD